MSKEVLQYLSICGFGLLVLLQPCASAVWGSSDVLNASYAHVDDDEADTSRRLGLLSSSVGLGCLIGPLLTNSLLDVDPPRKLQALCVWAFAWMALGWWGLSLVDEDDFFYICFYTFVRNIGSGVLWIDSTLLLQKLTAEEKLGRVLAFEHSIALALEALTAYLTGAFRDAGYSKSEIASMSGGLGFAFFLLWSVYHVFGFGAANIEFQSNTTRQSVNDNNPPVNRRELV